jgi:CheY-like chemotaxis protein
MEGPDPNLKKPLVYVVDDEEMLLELAQCVLEEQGCRWRTFLDPEQALAAFVAEPEKPPVLITDYAMGPINGLELIAKCRAVKPDLKAVVVSGSVRESFLAGSSVKIDSYLRKPYQLDEFAAMVREMLPPASPR